MSDPGAYYIAEGGAGPAGPGGGVFASTPLTRGPWSPELQHGGPPAALLLRAIEGLAGPDALVARLVVEFWRPVPVAPVAVQAGVVRAGRKVQVIEARLSAGGKDVARATGTCIRRTPVVLPPPPRRADGPDGPDGPDGAGFRPAPPGRCPPFEFPFFTGAVGYHTSIEGRLARGAFGRGSMAAWLRVRGSLVAGEAPSPLQRVAVVADSGNGVSLALDTARYTFVNPDLTVCVHRPPAGEWVCLDARTIADPGGTGLADTALFDERGPIGRGLQTLVVERRGGPGGEPGA